MLLPVSPLYRSAQRPWAGLYSWAFQVDTGTVNEPSAPLASVTVRTTSKSPRVAKVWVGLASVDSTPSPNCQRYEAIGPPSGSWEPEESKLTTSGAGPWSGVAIANATGGWLGVTGTVTATDAVPVAPLRSVTVSVAVKVPTFR